MDEWKSLPWIYATMGWGAERALPSLAAYSMRSYSSGYFTTSQEGR